ncbi:MAG TPA: hypothetical protein VFK06_06740 [Candidatus Angelobacter sp.]|nr:hypothetical protein [Candidatus Angelobacter sp.]
MTRSRAQWCSGLSDSANAILEHAKKALSRLCPLIVLLPASCLTRTTAEQSPTTKSHHTRKKMSFGNLRKLSLEGGAGHYALNGVALSALSGDPICLSTADQSFTVRATFLKTVPVSFGHPINRTDETLLETWRRQIPLVAKILKEHDSIGSIKPVAYDLIEPKDSTDFQLQEELVLLWSSDRFQQRQIGETTLMTPLPFHEQIVDVQYRGLNRGVHQLRGKIILQILYIRNQSRHALLGGFLIVSHADGDYDFYVVPRELLARINQDRLPSLEQDTAHVKANRFGMQH